MSGRERLAGANSKLMMVELVSRGQAGRDEADIRLPAVFQTKVGDGPGNARVEVLLGLQIDPKDADQGGCTRLAWNRSDTPECR
jgi:hypothetical protein